jgi:RHS repeat-associated protein
MVYYDEELSYILTPVGRAVPAGEGFNLEYFMRDHLGNVRIVFGDPDRDHEVDVIQENHYYPFGMTMGDLAFTSGLYNRYLYQGKETTSDLGLWWQDFHARRFDSQIGRWHVPDPAGQYASPYVGMGNNPLKLIDKNGLWAVGGPWHWSSAAKDAERVIADFRKRLMESYSYEEWERELERMMLWKDILEGKYKDVPGVRQEQNNSDLISDGTDGDDPTNPNNSYLSGQENTHEYHQWKELTPAEKEIIKQNPKIVFALLNNRQIAEKLTNEYFPNASAWNDFADAFRHAIFNALNTVSFGDNLTMQLGYAHEFFPNNPSLEFRMDIYNNAIGRYYGNIYSYVSVSELGKVIYNATIRGELRIIEDGVRLVPSNVP